MSQQLISNLQQQIEQLKLPVNQKGLIQLLNQRLLKLGDKLQASEEEKQVIKVEDLLLDLQKDISAIRQIVSLKADVSIDYEKITNTPTQKQLLTDNLSMEQTALDMTGNDVSRIYNFCSKATLQIENLLNYFYWRRYNSFSNFITMLKSYNTEFYNNKMPRKISDVELHSKMNAFEMEFHYPTGIQDSKLKIIRKIRNLDAHRCSVLLENYDEHFAKYEELKAKCIRFYQQQGTHFPKTPADKRIEEQGELAEFIKNRNFGLVREEVRDLYEKITAFLLPVD